MVCLVSGLALSGFSQKFVVLSISLEGLMEFECFEKCEGRNEDR